MFYVCISFTYLSVVWIMLLYSDSTSLVSCVPAVHVGAQRHSYLAPAVCSCGHCVMRSCTGGQPCTIAPWLSVARSHWSYMGLLSVSSTCLPRIQSSSQPLVMSYVLFALCTLSCCFHICSIFSSATLTLLTDGSQNRMPLEVPLVAEHIIMPAPVLGGAGDQLNATRATSLLST